MKDFDYNKVKDFVIYLGYQWEIDKISNILKNPCNNKDDFFKQYVWVVINSGMKYQVAIKIYDRIFCCLYSNKPISSVFGNKKKVNSIIKVKNNLAYYYNNYLNAEDKLSYLETLPYIGKITKYHLARNLGYDCCKPDRHLTRIATNLNMTVNDLCSTVSKESGDPVGLVDVIIWRAANLGFI